LGTHKGRPYNPTWDTAVIWVAWDGLAPAGKKTGLETGLESSSADHIFKLTL